MKRLYYILIAAACVSACNFLELNESDYQSKEYQFSTFENTKAVATNVYGYIYDYLSDVEGTMREAATDNAVYAWETSEIKRYYDGSWSGTRTIDDKWSTLYSAIAAANYYLENAPTDFPESRYLEDYTQRMEQLKGYPYEITALRAWFHFELLKRYNNIIIADRSFTLDEVNDITPTSYADAAQWIISELDGVIPMLPDSYAETYAGEVGRITKGAARAIKARTQLYLASPLNNTANDNKLWANAAATCKQIIDSGTYSLVDEDVVNNTAAVGGIFYVLETPSNSFESANFPIGFEGGNSGICPSLNLVEAFEDGDTRLAKTVYANGDSLQSAAIQTYYGGANGKPKKGATPTGFYLRKFIREETSFTVGNTTSYQHVVPLYRYAEVLLNYAEALFEASSNPSFKGSLFNVTYTLTPLQAVNMVRERAGLEDLPSSMSASEFRTALRNERRVELAFEDHRFWDIRRWEIGGETTKLYGLDQKIADDGTIGSSRILVQTRVWDDKMNFYPIPDSELYKNSNLVQNPGW